MSLFVLWHAVVVVCHIPEAKSLIPCSGDHIIPARRHGLIQNALCVSGESCNAFELGSIPDGDLVVAEAVCRDYLVSVRGEHDGADLGTGVDFV